MEHLCSEDQERKKLIRRVVLASFIGSAIKWYDFFVYGTAAALVFNVLFFPQFDSLTGTLAALSTFAIGFLGRPLGGLIIGHYGDKIGRKSMLVLTLLIMGISTFLIGLLPSYQAIGAWAPILLMTLRFCQGFAIGGEWGGGVLMVWEHAPRAKRGFYASCAQMGIPAGLALSTAVFLWLSLIPRDQFIGWGWRLAFLISLLLVIVGMFIRLRIIESPEFSRMKESGDEARMPMLEVCRTHPKNILLTMGARVAENGAPYIFTIFVLAYATSQFRIAEDVILSGILISNVVAICTIPVFGLISDSIGRRPVYMAGAALLGLIAFPGFWLISTRIPILVWLAFVIALSLAHAAMVAPQGSFFSELFSTRVRYSGVSLGSQIPSLVTGGASPLIATALTVWAGGRSWPVSLYLISMALMTFISVFLATETLQGTPDEIPFQESAVAK